MKRCLFFQLLSCKNSIKKISNTIQFIWLRFTFLDKLKRHKVGSDDFPEQIPKLWQIIFEKCDIKCFLEFLDSVNRTVLNEMIKRDTTCMSCMSSAIFSLLRLSSWNEILRLKIKNMHHNHNTRYQDWLTGILCLPFSISPPSSPGGLIKQPLRNGRTEDRLTAIRAGLTKDPLRSRGRTEYPPRNQQLAPPLQAIVHIPPHVQAVPSFSEIHFLSPFCFLFSRSFITWVVRPGNELPRSWPFIEGSMCLFYFCLLTFSSFADSQF